MIDEDEARLEPITEIVAGLPTPVEKHVAELPRGSAPTGSVWHLRDFRIVAVGEAISALGDAVSFTAMPLLVLALTGSGAAMGIVAALQTLPDLVLGLFAGALADRWDRRRMMIYADIGRALLTAAIPISVVLGLPTMTIILLVVFPINALRVVFMAGWTGAVPNLVGRGLIGPATSYFEAIFALGFILGPGLAGVLASRIGPGPTLAIDALSFVVSAGALLFVQTPLQTPPGEREETHILAEIRDGVAFVLRHRTLRVAVLFWGGTGIATAGLIPALTFFMTRDLRLGSETLGLVISAYSLGSLGGALLAARLSRGRLGALLLVGNAVTGALLVGIATATDGAVMATLAFVAGIANTIVLVSYVTIRASSTPDELLGRVGATTRLVSIGLQPIGAAVAGLLLDAIAGGPTIRLMGAALLIVSVGGLLSPSLRRARAAPTARLAAA
jgi:MFS transporter, ENTS family, enterobactin (siderophore) exporter